MRRHIAAIPLFIISGWFRNEEFYLPGYNAVWSGGSKPAFRSNVSPKKAKQESSMKQAAMLGKLSLLHSYE
jgi:hypothetical protein